MKKNQLILLFVFILGAIHWSEAQNLSLSNHTSAQILNGCETSNGFGFQLTNSVDYVATDVIYLSWGLIPGIDLNAVNVLVGGPGIVTLTGSNSAEITGISNTSVINIGYDLNLNCTYSNLNSQNISHTVDYSLNQGTILTTNSLGYLVSQASISFLSGTNLIVNNAVLNSTYTRTYTFKNEGSSIFNGYFVFSHNAIEQIQPTIQFNSIGVGVVSPGVTVTTVTSNQLNTGVSIKLNVVNLDLGDEFTITENVVVTGCQPSAVNTTAGIFRAYYGCALPDTEICLETNYNNVNNYTKATLDPTLIPDVEIIYDPENLDCVTDSHHSTLSIKNIGNGPASSARFEFNLPVSFPDTYNGNSYYMDEIDASTLTATIGGNLVAPGLINVSAQNGMTHFYITVNATIPAGDILTVDYDILTNCIDPADYNLYFGHTAFLHVFDHPLLARMYNPCVSIQNPENDSDYNYYNGDKKHPQQLQQSFTSLIGQMSDGYDAWFNIDNSTPLILGNQNVPYSRVPYDLDQTDLVVHLYIENGLVLQSDINNGNTLLNQVYLSSTNNAQLLPYDVNIIAGGGIGTGDLIVAKFKVPTSWYNSPVAYNQEQFSETNNLFAQFFNAFKVNFRLTANCAQAPSTGVVGIIQDFFVNPTPQCENCLIPLSRVGTTTNINCPGCVFPGWNLTKFTFERETIGIADNDNDHIPEVGLADPNLINLQAAMVGDVIVGQIEGFLTDGQRVDANGNIIGFTFENARDDYGYTNLFDEAMLHFTGVGSDMAIDALEFISAQCTLYFIDQNNPPQTFTISAADYGGSTIGLQLSVSQLATYGVYIDDYSEVSNIRIFPKFRITRNLNDCPNGNPFYGDRKINCFLHIGGTPFTALGLANSQYADAANPTTNDYLLNHTDEWDGPFKFWCTSYEGRFLGVGIDAQTVSVIAENIRIDVDASNDICRKRLNYTYGISIGKAYDHGIDNPADYAINQTSASIFHHEVRSLNVHDLLTFNYPTEYQLASLNFRKYVSSYNPIINLNSWAPTAISLLPSSPLLTLNFGSVSFDPSAIISSNEENQVYDIDVYLDPQSCSQINALVPYTNNQLDVSLSKAPANSLTDLWNPSGIENYSLTVNTNALNANAFNNVQPDFTLISGNSGLIAGQNFWDFSLETGADPNFLNWSANDYITESANNVFVTFNAPANFSNLTLLNDVETFENGNQLLSSPTLVPGWLGSSNAYELGYIGVDQVQHLFITKAFTIGADVSCSGLVPGETISFDVIIGWGCEAYPTAISDACHVETFTVTYTVPDIALQAVFNHDTNISACSITSDSIELYASTIGIDMIQISIEQHPNFTFIPNSAYLTNGAYTGSPLTSVQNGNELVWNITGINDLNSPVYGGNMVFHYQLQLECGADEITEQLTTTINAQSYCGGNVATITDDWLPQVLPNTSSIPDSLSFSIAPIIVNDCNSGAAITIQVTNDGTSPTGNLNTVTLNIPSDLIYSGSDPAVSVSPGGLEIELSGNLMPNTTETFVLPFQINSLSSCKLAVELTAHLQQSYLCNNENCLTEITEGSNFSQEIIINPEICAPNASFISESLCITHGGVNFNAATSPGTHSWLFDNILTSNAANPYFPVMQSGTYSVVHTITNDCGFSDTYSENVTISEFPTLTVVNPVNVICLGEDLEVTVASNGTVSWFPQPTSVSVDGLTAYYDTPQPGPGMSFDVTVSTTNICGTVEETLSIVVKDDCFPIICHIPDATTISNGSTNVSGITAQINSNITITGNIIYDNATIYIGTGYTITVPNNQTLTLKHCHLLACDDMWKGIIVQLGGNLIINNDSWIEDAETAVYISSPSDGVPPTLRVDGAIFNKNFIGIEIQDFVPLNTIQPYPNIFIRNAVFTNRQLTNWNTAASYRTLINTNTLSERCIIDNLPTANLLAPHVIDQAKCGILLDRVGVYNGTNYLGILIGSMNGHGIDATNMFDNLRTGILANDANFTVVNSIFQQPAIQFDSNEEDGVGIFATVYYSNNRKVMIAPAVMMTSYPYGQNFFYSMKTATRINKYKQVDIMQNDIRSTQTGEQNTGEFGIDVTQTINLSQINLNFNTIRNMRTGISLRVLTTQNEILTGPITIDNNIVQPGMIAGVVPPNTFVEQGIQARYMPSNGLLEYNPNSLVISNNQLSDVYNGIRVGNWRSAQVFTQQNVITMRSDLTSDLDFGIIHSNCYRDRIHLNTVKTIEALDDNMNGIYSQANWRNEVTCNTTEGMGRGIVFSGNHGQSVFRGNMMTNHLKAYVLTNGGEISTQGSLSDVSDNRWLGNTWNAGAGLFQTYTEGNSNPSNSLLYVRNVSTYTPTIHGNELGSVAYTNNGQSATVKQTFENLPFTKCTTKKSSDNIEERDTVSFIPDVIFNLYPNPTKNELNISCKDLSVFKSNVLIYDMLGKLVLESEVNFVNGVSKIELDLNMGVYQIHILNEEKGIGTVQRIIISN